MDKMNIWRTYKAWDKAHPSMGCGRGLTKVLTGTAAIVLMIGTAGAQSSGGIHTDGTAFKDDQGRTLILRGVNLSGTSKTPAKTSSDPRKVSFVGRPFPLTEADEHFRRLQSWGLTFERLIVPWELRPGIANDFPFAFRAAEELTPARLVVVRGPVVGGDVIRLMRPRRRLRRRIRRQRNRRDAAEVDDEY